MNRRTSNVICALGALALAPLATAQSVIYTLTGDQPGDHFGWSVARLADLNDDMHEDFVVGAPFNDRAGADAGSAYVISGRTGGQLFRFDGPQVQSFFGYSVASVGDLDGDNRVDIGVGAPGYDVGGASGADAGYVAVYSGATGNLLLTVNGITAGERFGSSLTGGRDFDGDGAADDFAVGVPGDPDDLNFVGSVRVYAGPAGGSITTLLGGQPGARFGHAVAGTNDTDLDGVDDLAVGAPLFDRSGAVDAGALRLFSMRTGAVRFTREGPSRGDNFGYSVAPIGDLTGSPADEILVGSRFELDRGRAHLLGGETGLSFRIHWGFVRSIWFGNAVGGAGDVDSDGVPDLIVGMPLHGVVPTDKTQIRGQARIVSGRTGYTLFSLDGLDHMGWFGFDVDGAGDVNNDCCDDYMVGAPAASGGRGTVTVFAGGKSSLSALILGLSVSSPTGSRQTMNLDAGPALGGQTYLLLGSMAWTRPGLPFGGFTIPLNPDPYFWFTASAPGVGLIQNQLGTLDASGRATASLTIPPPPGVPATLVGQTLHHAYVVFDASNNILFVSNPLPAYLEI